MKIAVTGGSGFIGAWFCLQALKAGHHVTVLGRAQHLTTPSLRDAGLPYAATDYSTDSLCRIIAGHDAVVHLAATKFSATWSREMYLQNLEVSYGVLEACRRASIANTVLLSTRGVYSEHNPIPWSEEIGVVPQNPYAAAKAAMESLCQCFNGQYGMRCKIFRLAQVLGHGERDGYMLTTFIRRAAAGETLYVHGTGSGRREFIYVKDVVAAILAALSHQDSAGIFNIGTGSNISVLQLAELINEIYGNRGNMALRPELPEDKSVNLLEVSKARDVLGWYARWPLEEALRDMREADGYHTTPPISAA